MQRVQRVLGSRSPGGARRAPGARAVVGHTFRWSDWFDGLAVCPELEGGTLLRGLIQDQSALLGLLTKMHALNLVLVSVQRLEK